MFSELCLCGYLPLDLLERPAFLGRNERELLHLAGELPISAIVGYAARANGSRGKAAANAAAFLTNGRIEFVQHKMLLPTYDVFDESRYFQFSCSLCKLHLHLTDRNWVSQSVKISGTIKAFGRNPSMNGDPVAELVTQGASFLFNISASPYTIDKRSMRMEMLRSLAKSHGLPVVYVNQVGGNDSLVFDGNSVVILPDGTIGAQAGSFAEDLIVFDTNTHSGDIHTQPADELELALQAIICGTHDCCLANPDLAKSWSG